MYAYSLDRNDIQIKSEILPPPGIKVREMRGTSAFGMSRQLCQTRNIVTANQNKGNTTRRLRGLKPYLKYSIAGKRGRSS